MGLEKPPLFKVGNDRKSLRTTAVVEDGELRDCWAESFCLIGKYTEQSTKLKLYVAFVKLNLAITLMQSTRQKAVPG